MHKGGIIRGSYRQRGRKHKDGMFRGGRHQHGDVFPFLPLVLAAIPALKAVGAVVPCGGCYRHRRSQGGGGKCVDDEKRKL